MHMDGMVVQAQRTHAINYCDYYMRSDVRSRTQCFVRATSGERTCGAKRFAYNYILFCAFWAAAARVWTSDAELGTFCTDNTHRHNGSLPLAAVHTAKSKQFICAK